MSSRAVRPAEKCGTSSKVPLLAFEALGSLACGYYGNYIFFLLRKSHGFGDLENLSVAALMGLVVALAAWQGGKLAQRCGCFRIMAFGLAGLIVSLMAGLALPRLPAQLAVLMLWTASQFVIWPALEALVAEGESGPARARLLGIYNMVWATCAALSYFFGGALFERLGSASLFWLPPVLHGAQLLILWRIAPAWRVATAAPAGEGARPPVPASGISPRAFQRMAWLANPFACVAAFTLLAMIPELAARLGLNVTHAGWFGSIWFFARLAAFAVLWRWQGWHYRFRWLLAGYLLLMAGFAVTLTARDLVWLSAGQVAFGFAVGLMYYASLFYSMDVGESRAEQGGIHEAMMGAGNFIGPGIGALGMVVAPQLAHAGVWAVSGLLCAGLAVLVRARSRAAVSLATELSRS